MSGKLIATSAYHWKYFINNSNKNINISQDVALLYNCVTLSQGIENNIEVYAKDSY